MNEQPRLYLNHLDSVRGFAILTTVWVHFCGDFHGETKAATILWGTPFSFLIEGNGALSMFFVISGLVLSLRYFLVTSPQEKYLNLANFYITRFFRIIPLLFFILGLSFMAYLWLYERIDTNPPISDFTFNWWKPARHTTVWSFIKQGLLLFPDTRPVLIPQSWVIKDFLQMYLIFPFLLLIGKKSTSLLTVFVVLMVTVFDVSNFIVNFYLGILLAKHYRQLLSWYRQCHWFFKAFIFSLGYFLYTYHHPMIDIDLGLNRMQKFYVSAFGSALLLVCLEGSERAKQFFSNPRLRFLGKISYSLYLTQFLIFMVITPWVILSLNKVGFVEEVAFCMALVVTTLICIVFSYVTWQLVERPSLAFGRWLIAAINRNRGKTTT